MKPLLVVASSLALLALAACGGGGGGTGPGAVVAAVYPLEYVAQRVAGDGVEVVGLVEPGHEAHEAELSVEETAEVAEAALVLRVEGLTPALDEAVAERDDEVDVEALSVLEQRDPALGGARPVRVLDGDPHFWLDPRALATYAEEVEERLVALDPEQAEDYRENTAELAADLSALDGQMSVALDDCARRTVVVSHEA